MITTFDIMDWYEDYCDECAEKGIQPMEDMMEWWESLE